MYRVLVAEDEPFINESIGKMIETFAPDYKVCASVYDGEEALERLKREEFDVVFTDVRMPGADGIEVLKYVYQNAPQTITVVISGFEIFDYAQKALQYHVFEYLLKPVSIQDMKELLSKITEQLVRREELRREKYFHRIFSGKDTAQESPEEEKRDYRMYLLNMGSYKSMEAEEAAQEDRLSGMEQRLEERFRKEGMEQWLCFRRYPSTEFVIIEEFKDSHSEEGEKLHFMRSLYEELRETDIPVTVLEGTGLSDMNRLYGEYRLLHKMLRDNLVYGFSSFLHSNHLHGREMQQEMPTDNLLLYAKAGNVKYMEKEIGGILDGYREKRVTQAALEESLLSVALRLADETGDDGRFSRQTVEKEIRYSLCMADTYEQLKPMLFDVMSAVAGTHREDEADRLADHVRSYLDKNYSSKITTKELSRQFGLVPSYFSMLFRQSQGISPSDYLNDIRIRKAKELLVKEEKMTVKEVAELVGFTDQLYFSKVFKKETGKTPSGFRDSK